MCLVVQCRKKVVAARLFPSLVKAAMSHGLNPLRSAFPQFSLSSLSNRPFRLILTALEQPLCHLVLLNNVDVRTPTGQGISVDGVQQGLGDGLEELVGSL